MTAKASPHFPTSTDIDPASVRLMWASVLVWEPTVLTTTGTRSSANNNY